MNPSPHWRLAYGPPGRNDTVSDNQRYAKAQDLCLGSSDCSYSPGYSPVRGTHTKFLHKRPICRSVSGPSSATMHAALILFGSLFLVSLSVVLPHIIQQPLSRVSLTLLTHYSTHMASCAPFLLERVSIQHASWPNFY